MKNTLAICAVDRANESGAFDTNASLKRMTKLRGRGGEADYDIGEELIRAKTALAHGQFGKYLRNPAVDLGRRRAQEFMELTHVAGGRELCRAHGMTKVLQLNRFSDEEQRDDFLKEYPAEKHTAKKLRLLIDDTLGHTRIVRKSLPRLGVSSILAKAAGMLHVEPSSIDPTAVEEHYTLLVDVFTTRPECHPLLRQLEEAKTLLDSVLAKTASDTCDHDSELAAHA